MQKPDFCGKKYLEAAASYGVTEKNIAAGMAIPPGQSAAVNGVPSALTLPKTLKQANPGLPGFTGDKCDTLSSAVSEFFIARVPDAEPTRHSAALHVAVTD